MHTVTRRIACFCEKTFEAEMPDAVDLATDGGAADAILGGEFMAATCPACGKRLTPEFPCLVSMDRDIPGAQGRGVLLVPEADRVACMRGRLPEGMAVPARLAIGVPELMEKLLVFRASLDDRVIEIVKYYYLTSAAAGASAGDRDVILRFQGEEAGRLVFHIDGLAEGQIGVARLPRDIYARIEADLPARLAEEPFREFCEPPYVSLRRAEFAG